MKRHHFNFLSFLFVIGLMIAGVLATYVATTGTGGFMTRAAKPTKTVCEKAGFYGKSFCNKKSLCGWVPNDPTASQKIQDKVGTCVSRADAKSTKCSGVGDVCCTNGENKGTCDNVLLSCNPTTYKCVPAQLNLGQERGVKGTCSVKFTGASCKWNADCLIQGGEPMPKSGYCKGPAEWLCCKPKPAVAP